MSARPPQASHGVAKTVPAGPTAPAARPRAPKRSLGPRPYLVRRSTRPVGARSATPDATRAYAAPAGPDTPAQYWGPGPREVETAVVRAQVSPLILLDRIDRLDALTLERAFG